MRPDETAENLLHTRQFLYTLTARAFADEPDETLLAAIQDEFAETALQVWKESMDDDREACQHSRSKSETDSSAKSLSSGKDDVNTILVNLREVSAPEALPALKREYTKLMIGPEKLPVPLWESVYTTGEELLFQQSTLEVRKAYREAGFEAAGYPHEPDDHIATELNFMAALAGKTIEAFDQEDIDTYRASLQAQKRFLGLHILTWVSSFCNLMHEQNKISCFYASFAELTALVCTHDRALIKRLLLL